MSTPSDPTSLSSQKTYLTPITPITPATQGKPIKFANDKVKPKVEPKKKPVTSKTEKIDPDTLTKEVKDKMGRSTSCYLCQKRKQKCDHRIPCCTTCIKAGVPCIQPPRYASANKPNSKDEYTVMLEKRVKQLERMLDKLTSENKTEDSKQSIKRKFEEGESEEDGSDTIKQEEGNGESNLKYRKISDLLDQTSSENDPFVKLLKRPADEFLQVQHEKFLKSIIARYNLKDNFKPDPIFDIDIKLSQQLMDIYFALLQYKFPLLNETQVLKFHNDYFVNKARGAPHPPNNRDYLFSCTRMFLIFAISAELHKTTGRYTGPPPSRFFSSALRYLTLLSNVTDLQKVELLILIVFYLIRTDTDSNVLYAVIADGMKICVSLNLHKRKTYEKISRDLKDSQLRCFWCAYLLEKAIAIAVSRPFILLESQIDENIMMFDYEPSKAIHPSKTTFINQSIKIRRIEARFIEQLNILTSNSIVTRDQLPKVEGFFQELANWRKECQGFRKGIENETLSVYYYRSVRNLIQPFLELLDPEDKLFRECQACAGQICQSIKAFIQKTVSGHSTVHIHTAFSAGITLIYCLWLHRNRDDMRRKLLGDDKKHTRPAVSEALFSGLDDLRACSDALYVMAERTKFALNFRDTFEEIMHATIGNLILRCGPDSSEIIYNSQPGVPPAIVRKPLQHYTVESKVDIKKTEAEKQEEEERVKQKGQLTRCTIPRGLSHLLIHSPDLGPETSNKRLSTNGASSLATPMSSGSANSPQNSINATLPSFSSANSSLFKTTSITAQPFSYLPAASVATPTSITSATSPERQRKESIASLSSFTSREREQTNGNSLSSTTTLTNRAALPSPMSYEAAMASSPSPSFQAITPIISSLNMNPQSSSSYMPPNLNNPSSNPQYLYQRNGSKQTTTSNSNAGLQDLGSSKMHQPHQPPPQQQPPYVFSGMTNTSSSVSTPLTTTLTIGNSNKLNMPSVTQTNGNSLTPPSANSMPELLPFVGRTTTMINNISVWTGESGQQIPNTGVVIKNGQVQIQNNSDNTGTNNNLEVFSAWGNEDFWNVTDNFGFLP